MPSSCSRLYRGQTGYTAECLKEHDPYVRLNQPKQSNFAAHCLMFRHQPALDSYVIVSRMESSKVIAAWLAYCCLERRDVNTK